MRSRRELARGLQRVVADAARADASRWPRPRCAGTGCGPRQLEFQALAGRLLSPAPLRAGGVAQVRVLLSDGGGPLYRRGCRDDLRARVTGAIRSLDQELR